MQPVTAKANPSLLQRVDRPDTHDTRKQDSTSQSLFASYAFGPMDLQQGESKSAKKADLSVSGVGLGKNPLSAASLSFVTSVQDVGSTSDSGTTTRK